MSKEELKATQGQIHQLEIVRKAIGHMKQRAAECNDLGLGPLARGWDAAAKVLEADLSTQLRILKGNVPEGFTS